MQTFHDLVQSRRAWIQEILIPWCLNASRKDLLLAEQEWQDLAGRPAPEMTLWVWAWRRFPQLCNPQLGTINETHRVTIHSSEGITMSGYPDAQLSQAGLLFLQGEQGRIVGPISIDDVLNIEIVE